MTYFKNKKQQKVIFQLLNYSTIHCTAASSNTGVIQSYSMRKGRSYSHKGAYKLTHQKGHLSFYKRVRMVP